MPPLTSTNPLSRRYTYSCSDYTYTATCAPHRIIIGAIVAFVAFALILVIVLLCLRHRKHKSRTAVQTHPHPYRPEYLQKQAHMRLFEAEPELTAPPPAYARVAGV